MEGRAFERGRFQKLTQNDIKVKQWAGDVEGRGAG